MTGPHSNPAAVALRALRDGPGGGVLVVHGEPGAAARFPAGLRNRPVPSLLESVLAYAADPDGYQSVWVFSAAGHHLPADVVVGPARTRIRLVSCGWVLRGPDPTAATPPPAGGQGGFADLVRLATGGGNGRAAAPLLERFEGGWVRTVPALLNRLEEACGKQFTGDTHAPAPGGPTPRTLVLLDEGLVLPVPGDVGEAAAAPVQFRRRLADRLNALPAVARGTRTDLVLLARSAETAAQLRAGRFGRDQFARLYQQLRHDLDPARAADDLLPDAVGWPDVAAVEMPRVDQAPPLAAPDPTARLYDIARGVAPRPPADPLGELRGMIGLAAVKREVEDAYYRARDRALRRRRGMPDGHADLLHMIFAGNPGTGKTTVARMVAQLYARSGLLSGDKVTEITAGDLVAGYVGQSREKAAKKLEEAAGGVLFIDEAYDLTPKGENDFTHEVLNLIIRWMTERREDLAVILAGYPDEMRELAEANPGFFRRLRWVPFEDYTDAELLEIARGMLTSAGDRTDPAVEAVLARKVAARRAACDRAEASFGNAGEVERLLAEARKARSRRLYAGGGPEPTEEEQAILLPGDIESVVLTVPPPRRADRRRPR